MTLEKALMLHRPSVSVYDIGMSPFEMNPKGRLIMSNAYIMHIYVYIKQWVFTVVLCWSKVDHILYARNVRFPTKGSITLV